MIKAVGIQEIDGVSVKFDADKECFVVLTEIHKRRMFFNAQPKTIQFEHLASPEEWDID